MPSNGVELIEQLEIPGYGADEVGFMEETMFLCKPSFVADWGTNLGSSARIFFELGRLHKLHPFIVTIDLPPMLSYLDRDHAGARTGMLSKDRSIIHLRGDGVTCALEQYVHYGRPRHSLFFVDGDHSHCNVVRELDAIARIAPEAIILLHDTRLQPGTAIEEFTGISRPTLYRCDELLSQAGMSRLVPLGLQIHA